PVIQVIRNIHKRIYLPSTRPTYAACIAQLHLVLVAEFLCEKYTGIKTEIVQAPGRRTLVFWQVRRKQAKLRVEVSLLRTQTYLITQFVGQFILIVGIQCMHATGHIKIVAYRVIRQQAIGRIYLRILMLQTAAHSSTVTGFEFMVIAKRTYIIELDIDIAAILLRIIDAHTFIHFLRR